MSNAQFKTLLSPMRFAHKEYFKNRIPSVFTVILCMFPFLAWSASPQREPGQPILKRDTKSYGIYEIVMDRKGWEQFPWDTPEKSALLTVPGYQDQSDHGEKISQRLTVISTPVGKIEVDVNGELKSTHPPYNSFFVNLAPDGVDKATCDSHLQRLTQAFGKPSAMRDVSVSNPILNLNKVGAQWWLKDTVATWTCTGFTSPKRWSYVVFSHRSITKTFTNLVPLKCVTYTKFADGDIKRNDFEIVVDEYDGILRRIDNTPVVIGKDVEISERYITYKLGGFTSSIDRTSGRYKDETTIASLNVTVESSGSCEAFDPKQRKF